MKNLVLAAMMLLCVCGNITAQNVVKNGNVYSYQSSRTTKKDTLLTKFQFEDSKGNKYPIIINKSNGRCYIWKKSGKTGKLYKQYMKNELAMAICKELGITFIPAKSK